MLVLIVRDVLTHQHLQFAVDGSEVLLRNHAELVKRLLVGAERKLREVGRQGNHHLQKNFGQHLDSKVTALYNKREVTAK